jgi:hypothetical protein
VNGIFHTGRLLIALLVLALTTGASAQTRFEVGAGSQFRIDGTSTVGRYTCEAGTVAGHGLVGGGVAVRVTGEVVVPVRTLDCGVGQMNRDLYEALGSDRHPTIRLALERIEMPREWSGRGAWVPVRAWGRIRMAGAERPVQFNAEGRQLRNGHVQIRGEHALRMTDFGVEPPTGMLGLVRAHDQVRVVFDLVAVEV